MFGGSYREGVDVWAAGVSFFKMVCGYTPFESEYLIQTKDNILGGELVFPEIFNNYSIELKELISKMLTRDVNNRASMSDCLIDDWLSDAPE